MVEKKTKLRPSDLPYLFECPCFERPPFKPNKYMVRGTNMDALFRSIIEKENSKPDSTLAPQDLDNVNWAVEQVQHMTPAKVIASKAGCKLPFTVEGVTFNGEADAIAPETNFVWDLKTGRARDYYAQLIAYCYGAMKKYDKDKFTASILFCDLRRIQTFSTTLMHAENALGIMVTKINNPYRTPSPSNHACEFCTHRNMFGKCNLVVKN